MSGVVFWAVDLVGGFDSRIAAALLLIVISVLVIMFAGRISRSAEGLIKLLPK